MEKWIEVDIDDEVDCYCLEPNPECKTYKFDVKYFPNTGVLRFSKKRNGLITLAQFLVNNIRQAEFVLLCCDDIMSYEM
jgi:hypothetical protein